MSLQAVLLNLLQAVPTGAGAHVTALSYYCNLVLLTEKLGY